MHAALYEAGQGAPIYEADFSPYRCMRHNTGEYSISTWGALHSKSWSSQTGRRHWVNFFNPISNGKCTDKCGRNKKLARAESLGFWGFFYNLVMHVSWKKMWHFHDPVKSIEWGSRSQYRVNWVKIKRKPSCTGGRRHCSETNNLWALITPALSRGGNKGRR